jgi:hypothetical protein
MLRYFMLMVSYYSFYFFFVITALVNIIILRHVPKFLWSFIWYSALSLNVINHYEAKLTNNKNVISLSGIIRGNNLTVIKSSNTGEIVSTYVSSFAYNDNIV